MKNLRNIELIFRCNVTILIIQIHLKTKTIYHKKCHKGDLRFRGTIASNDMVYDMNRRNRSVKLRETSASNENDEKAKVEVHHRFRETIASLDNERKGIVELNRMKRYSCYFRWRETIAFNDNVGKDKVGVYHMKSYNGDSGLKETIVSNEMVI